VKLLVISDSHGNKNAILNAVAHENPDLILHLGDHDKDCSAVEREFPEVPLRSVRGNCDRFSSGLEIDEFMLDGMRFFMTHGHLYGVKTGFSSIIDSASVRSADVLLFGHTHIPHFSYMEKIAIINPGSISTGGKTYAVLDLKNGGIDCEIKSV
jgi:putative phosphoesterase